MSVPDSNPAFVAKVAQDPCGNFLVLDVSDVLVVRGLDVNYQHDSHKPN